MTTPSDPTAEVRRQARQWQADDRMHREKRSPLPGSFTWLTALMIAAILTAWVAVGLPHHEPAPMDLVGWETCNLITDPRC